MQCYGLKENEPILALDAKKGELYQCPECLHPLRVRGGPHRQIHFYHLQTSPFCLQNQKSLQHLHCQLFICSLLPDKEAVMEKPFPSIGRIADVFWEKEKIVFEIQCSPISLEESSERCDDYERLGLIPVWILHDHRFNKKNLSAAESSLRKRTCYFTNMDEKGLGVFYDQFDVCARNRRLFRGAPLKIDLTRPLIRPFSTSSHLPEGTSLARLRGWQLHFSGDLGDQISFLPPDHFSLKRMQDLEKRWGQSKTSSPSSFFDIVKQFYKALFYMLLEKLAAKS